MKRSKVIPSLYEFEDKQPTLNINRYSLSKHITSLFINLAKIYASSYYNAKVHPLFYDQIEETDSYFNPSAIDNELYFIHHEPGLPID